MRKLLILAALCALCPLVAQAANCTNTVIGTEGITCVNTATGSSTGTGTTQATSTSLNVLAGDSLIVSFRFESACLGFNTGASAGFGIYDTAGNYYNLANQLTGGGGGWCSGIAYVCHAVANAATTPTMYFASNNSFMSLIVTQFRGLATRPNSVGCFDQNAVAGTTASGNSATTGAVSTGYANEILIAAGAVNSTGLVFTAQGSFTQTITDAQGMQSNEYLGVTGLTVGQVASMTWNSTVPGSVVMATFVGGANKAGTGIPSGHAALIWAATNQTSTQCGAPNCILKVTDSAGNTYVTDQTNDQPSANVTNYLARAYVGTALPGDGSAWVKCSFFTNNGSTPVGQSLSYCRLFDMGNSASTNFDDSHSQTTTTATTCTSGSGNLNVTGTDLVFSVIDTGAPSPTFTVSPAQGYKQILFAPDLGGGAQFAEYIETAVGVNPSVTYSSATTCYGADVAVKESKAGGQITYVNGTLSLGTNPSVIFVQIPQWYGQGGTFVARKEKPGAEAVAARR
jgi:hypothetical protein